MMRTIATIVRLRWTLTFAVLRKSVWQTAGYVLSLTCAVAMVAGVLWFAWYVGDTGNTAMNVYGAQTYAAGLAAAVVLVGAVIGISIVLIQLMVFGEGKSMGPRRFELYGIPDRILHAGLLISGLADVSAIGGVLALIAWSVAYRWMSPAVVIAAIVCAPLVIVTTVSLSKMVVSLADTLVRSTRSRNLFYCVVIVVFILLCQLPSMLLNSSDTQGMSLEAFESAANVMAWTPFGAPYRIPFDVACGDWALVAARVVVLGVTCVLCFMVSTWCLRHERMVAGSPSSAVSTKGMGAFSWMPDSVSGAISARLFTYLKRDPRQGMMFAMPILFLVICTVKARGQFYGDDQSVAVLQSLIYGGLFLSLAEANGLAYDGRGWTMQVIAGVRGFDDRVGRVRVYAVLSVIYTLLLSVACLVITGDWNSVGGILTGLTFAAVAVATTFCGLGLAEVLSCVLMYPVPSIDKPFSSPQGRVVAQILFPLAHIAGILVLMFPVGIAALALALSGWWSLYWVLIPVSLVDGTGFLILGSWLGGKLMDARTLTIMRTLDSFASLQK